MERSDLILLCQHLFYGYFIDERKFPLNTHISRHINSHKWLPKSCNCTFCVQICENMQFSLSAFVFFQWFWPFSLYDFILHWLNQKWPEEFDCVLTLRGQIMSEWAYIRTPYWKKHPPFLTAFSLVYATTIHLFDEHQFIDATNPSFSSNLPSFKGHRREQRRGRNDFFFSVFFPPDVMQPLEPCL